MPVLRSRQLIGVVAAAALLGPSASAGVVAVQTATRAVEIVDESGETRIEHRIAEKVAPGEAVRFTIAWSNNGEAPASDVAFVMPIPEHMAFVAGSVGPEGVPAVYSLDGGQTWLAAPEDPDQPDASVTHVRWSFDEDIAPQAAGEVWLEARLD